MRNTFTNQVTAVSPLTGATLDGSTRTTARRRTKSKSIEQAAVVSGWGCPACGFSGSKDVAEQLAHITGEYLKVMRVLDGIREVLPDGPRRGFKWTTTESPSDRIDSIEAARILGMTDRGVRYLIGQGSVTAERVGKYWTFNRSEILSLASVRPRRDVKHG